MSAPLHVAHGWSTGKTSESFSPINIERAAHPEFPPLILTSLPLVNPVYFSESSQTSAHLLQLLGTHIELHVHICGFLMSSVHIYSFTHQSLKHPRRAQGHITAFVGPTQFTFMVLSLQKHIKTFITVLA